MTTPLLHISEGKIAELISPFLLKTYQNKVNTQQ